MKKDFLSKTDAHIDARLHPEYYFQFGEHLDRHQVNKKLSDSMVSESVYWTFFSGKVYDAVFNVANGDMTMTKEVWKAKWSHWRLMERQQQQESELQAKFL